MVLQTLMTNRRKFPERSMWGFGSAFLLPSLLTSCTDHIIPPPGSPVDKRLESLDLPAYYQYQLSTRS